MPASKAPLVVIVGPTGSGKSDLGLCLAERFRGEIVNCDSVQVYRGFDIGAAKTPAAERHRIPHHLLDITDAAQHFTAGDYQRIARKTLREIGGRERLPIVVGGTGFYLRALLEGLFAGPGRDEEIRERLRRRSERRPEALHRLLRRLDAAAAAAIHPNDLQKLIRALEVCLSTRKPLTVMQAATGMKPLEGFRILTLGLQPPREKLRQRIAERTQRMFANGLLEETHQLLQAGVPRDAKPMQSVGYAQAGRVLEGRMSLAAAIEDTTIRTRQYAKRQMTWFRRDASITWLPDFGNAESVQISAQNIVKDFLSEAR